MSLILTTPPALLSADLLDDIKAHVRRTDTVDDTYLSGLVDAAAALFERRLGRALLTQTWTLSLDCFPDVIRLELPPVQSVASVKYMDESGTLQTLAADAYRVTDLGAWESSLWPAFGQTWPSIRAVPAAVQAAFVAGYGDDSDAVPAPILQAIRELVGHWYQDREAVSLVQPYEVPWSIKELVAPYRVFR